MRALGGWACALFAGLASVAVALGEDRAYKVVVNAANPLNEIKKHQLATFFLNRTARWSHGPDGAPVDQSMKSPIRVAFTRDVLGLSLSGIESYWRRRMLSDRETPPPVKSSDDEVIAHTQKNKGGVGYVSATAVLPVTVKVLQVVE